MDDIIPIINSNESDLKQFIKTNTKDINVDQHNIAFIINETINEGIKLNMNQFEILTVLNNEFKNSKKIINNLIKSRFTESKLKNIKMNKELNKNIIFKNTLDFLSKLLKDKDINLDNILENIYDLSKDLIEFVMQYKIDDNEKNKLIIQVLLNIIEDIITDLSLVDKENLKMINDVKKFIEDTLPSYIKCIIEADLNEEAIVQTKKHCIKLLFSCILKSS